MKVVNFIERLKELGRIPDVDGIKSLSGAGIHRSVANLSIYHVQTVLAYFKDQSTEDQHALIKAIAIYEDTRGGLGSVTLLEPMIHLITEGQELILDWVLRNTDSYRHYSHGAKNFREYEAAKERIAERRNESMRREAIRQAAAKERTSIWATGNLYNAVRRGDIKAVCALLAKGADPNVPGPGGESLVELALSIQRQDIAATLNKGAL